MLSRRAAVAPSPDPDVPLQRALSGIRAPFAGFVNVLDAAVNPALKLHNTSFGLPLTSRDEPEILCSAREFGRYGYEIPAESVAVGNARWGQWFEQNAVESVRSWLGVHDEIRTSISRAVVFTKGRVDLDYGVARVDGEEKKGFGNLMVVLPSCARFALRVPTVDRYEDVACGRGDTATSTTEADTVVAGWYDGVRPLMEVESGFCVALVFRLVAVTHGPQPALVDHSLAFQEVRKQMEEYRVACHNSKPRPAVACVLNKLYDEFDANAPLKLDQQDMFKVFALRRMAPDMGLRLYSVKMRLRCEGVPYLPNYPAETGLDVVSMFELDDEELYMGKVTESRMFLSEWKDWTAGDGRPIDGFDVENDSHRMSEDFSYWNPEYLARPDFKVHSGSRMSQCVMRTALVVWPEDCHAQAVVNMCVLNPERATKFLDIRMWPGASKRSREQRALLAAAIHERLTRVVDYSQGRDPDQQQCLQNLLDFALVEEKMELFGQFLQLSSGPGKLSVELHRQALTAFGTRWEEYVDAEMKKCMGRNAVPAQIQIADAFHERTGRVERLKEFLDEAIPQEKFDKLDPRQLHNMLQIRPVVFKSCVLPRLKNFGATEFWMKLERNAEFKEYVQSILPHLAEAHVPYNGSGAAGRSYVITVDLLVRCAKRNLYQQAQSIVTKVLAMQPATDEINVRTIQRYFMDLTNALARALTSADIPLDTAPFSTLFEDAILDFILPPLGPRPMAPAPAPKIAVPHDCEACNFVTSFLFDDSADTANRAFRTPVLYHLSEVLTPHLTADRANFTIRVSSSLPTGDITLTKPSYKHQQDLHKWNTARSTLANFLQRLPAACLGAHADSLLAALHPDSGAGWSYMHSSELRALSHPLPPNIADLLAQHNPDLDSSSDGHTSCPSPRKRKFVLLDLADSRTGQQTPPLTPGLKRPRSALAQREPALQQPPAGATQNGLQTPRSYHAGIAEFRQ